MKNALHHFGGQAVFRVEYLLTCRGWMWKCAEFVAHGAGVESGNNGCASAFDADKQSAWVFLDGRFWQWKKDGRVWRKDAPVAQTLCFNFGANSENRNYLHRCRIRVFSNNRIWNACETRRKLYGIRHASAHATITLARRRICKKPTSFWLPVRGGRC